MERWVRVCGWQVKSVLLETVMRFFRRCKSSMLITGLDIIYSILCPEGN